MGANNTKDTVEGSNGRRGLRSGLFHGEQGQELFPAESDDKQSWILDCDFKLGCCAPTKTQTIIMYRIDGKSRLGRSVESVTSSDEQAGKRRRSFDGQATPEAKRGFASYRRLSELDLAAAVHENTGANCKLTFNPKGLLKSKQGFVHFNGESTTNSLRRKQAVISRHHNLW
eukprot:767915-Hanusia_phi.AAC.5